MDVEQRFWAKVDKSGLCWNWLGALLQEHGSRAGGYGRFTLGHRKTVYAHRFVYELLNGPIPEGLTIDHLCRNRRCVNPLHLQAVDHKTNILRGLAPAARNVVKTHCPQGHELNGANLAAYQLRVGKRACRICSNSRLRAKRRGAIAA